MPRLSDFATALQPLIWQVYAHRMRLRSNPGHDGKSAINEIYMLYSGSGPQAAGYDDDTDRGKLATFLAGLTTHSGGRRVRVQGYPEAYFPDIVRYSGGNRPPVNQQVVDVRGELWVDFYHVYSRTHNPNNVKTRIYLHAADPVGVNGLALMKRLIPLLDEVPGFQQVKVAGPGASDRSDTIVAYLDDRTAAQTVINKLFEESLTVGFLAPGLPPGILSVKSGVGLADEPPGVSLLTSEEKEELVSGVEVTVFDSSGNSFGTYLSTLLWWALDATPTDAHGGDFIAFLEQVLIAFRVAQMDPMHPESHANRGPIEAQENAALFERQKRLNRLVRLPPTPTI